MEKVLASIRDRIKEDSEESKTYVPYPGADEKYDDGSDWRVYNPAKYRDPNWSPEKE